MHRRAPLVRKQQLPTIVLGKCGVRGRKFAALKDARIGAWLKSRAKTERAFGCIKRSAEKDTRPGTACESATGLRLCSGTKQ